MQRDETATLRTSPFLDIFPHELPGSGSFHASRIFDKTDPIALPVSFVNPLDCLAGE
jgi:hypothetical protein